MRGTVYRYLRYGGCAALGIVFFLGAEAADTDRQTVDKGILKRNPWGQRDAVYEFYAEGLEEGAVELAVTVPPRRLSPKEFHQRMPEISEILLSGILGSNVSLDQIRTDLELPEELPEYGIQVGMECGEAGASEQHGAFKPGRAPGGGPVQGGNVLFDGGAFMRRGEGAGDGPSHRPSRRR